MKHETKPRLLLALMAAGLALSTAASAQESVTLNYWGFSDALASETNAAAVAEFESTHPGVKINGVVLSGDDISIKIPSVFNRPGGPDIVYSGSEPTNLGRYVNVGQVLALDDVWAEYGWDRLVPGTQERVTYNGHKYAVGNSLETVGLVYNKRIFERLGLEVPQTLEDLESVMAKIKQDDPSLTPMLMACGGPCYTGLHMILGLTYAAVPKDTVLATTPNGSGAYTDEGWLKMLQRLKSWNDNGYLTAGANGIPTENDWADLCAGKTAMMAKGPWMFKQLSECEAANPDTFAFGFAAFPSSAELPFQAYVGTGKSWFFPANLADNPAKMKAALEFVSAMTSDQGARSWLEKDKQFPAVSFDSTGIDLTDAQRTTLGIFERAGVNGGAVNTPFNNSAQEVDVWVKGLQGIFGGSATPEEVIASLQAQLEADQAAWKRASVQ